MMGIGCHTTVTGKMFGYTGQALTVHTLPEMACQLTNNVRIAVQGTIPDHCRDTGGKIDTRREVDVDAQLSEFVSQQLAPNSRKSAGTIQSLAIGNESEAGLGRKTRDTIAQALHSPSFLIDGDEERRLAQGVNFVAEFPYLAMADTVARKEDDATHRWVQQPLAILRSKGWAGHVDHQGAKGEFSWI